MRAIADGSDGAGVAIGRGLLAGFIATIILSAIMVAKSAMGLMPELDVIAMLTRIASTSAGLPPDLAVGWILHFLVGTVLWGGLFACVQSYLPTGNVTVRGILFGIAAWLLMMVLVMPAAGAGLFGLDLGIGAPIATLVLHVIFGAALGGAYGRLSRA